MKVNNLLITELNKMFKSDKIRIDVAGFEGSITTVKEAIKRFRGSKSTVKSFKIYNNYIIISI